MVLFRFFKHLFIGYASFAKASVFIVKHKLWIYFIVPVLLLVAIYFSAEYIFDRMVKGFDYNHISNLEFSELAHTEELYAMLWLAIQIIIVFVAVKFSNYIVLMVLTPVLTLLSAKTDSLITGNVFPTPPKQHIRDILRALRLQVRNILIFMIWIAGWYVFSLTLIPFEDNIPVSRPFMNAAMIFLIGCYFYGFSLMDYTNERRRLSIEDSIRFVRRHAGIAFALGSVYSALFFIPLVGVVVSPVLSVVAATIAISRVVDLSDNPYAKPKKPKKDKTEIQNKQNTTT